MKPPTLRTVRQFSDRYEAWTEASLRWLIFRADQNGFAPALKRVGRRVLIDEEEFFRIIEAQNQQDSLAS